MVAQVTVTMTTFIIGAKPDPVFPQVRPDAAYFANAAVAYAERFDAATRKTGVLSDYLLTEDIVVNHLGLLREACLDHIVITRAAPVATWPIERTGMRHGSKVELTSLDRQAMTMSVLGRRFLLLAMLSAPFSWRRKVRSLGSYALRRNELGETKLSTGAFSLVLAILDQDAPPPYYLIGIGVEPGGHFYDANHRYDSERHLNADRVAFRCIAHASSRLGGVFATDEGLSKCCGIPLDSASPALEKSA